jgi:Carboxypeptidase regulatory-like domain
MTASKAARFLRKFLRQAAFPAILLHTCLGRLSARVVTATVAGTVADSTGAVVPGAVVRIENTGTHEGRTTTSTRDGFYSFQELQPGHFSLPVNMSGLAGFTVKRIQLAAGDRPRVDAALWAATTSEKVQVTGAGFWAADGHDQRRLNDRRAHRAGHPDQWAHLHGGGSGNSQSVCLARWTGWSSVDAETDGRPHVHRDRPRGYMGRSGDGLSPGSSCHRSARFPFA